MVCHSNGFDAFKTIPHYSMKVIEIKIHVLHFTVGKTVKITNENKINKQHICIKATCINMSRRMGKPTICIGENKGADQLRSNCEADQRLCFHYTDSTIPLLLKSEIPRF